MYATVKRGFDIVLSLLLLLVLSPLLLLIAAAVAISSPGKVIFMQQRAGRYGRPFWLYKFRTMVLDAPAAVPTRELRNAHAYITPIGRLLRRLSLDELPQLVNILKGDMSFVGPRPVVLSERELLRYRRDNGADRVRPGITGLAQVRGRDRVSAKRKARYDAFYVRHQSAGLDLYIVLLTALYVVTGEGIYEGGSAEPVYPLPDSAPGKPRDRY